MEEYEVILAMILVIVLGTVRLIGGNSLKVFSTVNHSLTQPSPTGVFSKDKDRR